MTHRVHRKEGEVEDVPFFGNDMKDHAATMDRPLDTTYAPGKADSEMVDDGAPSASQK